MAKKSIATEVVPEAPGAPAKLNGVVIGVLMGRGGRGEPLVIFPGNPVKEAVPARCTVRLEPADFGTEVALMFEQGDPRRPIVLGRLLHPDDDPPPAKRSVQLALDDERVELTAQREIVLRCGKASITLTRAGKILLRGAYILSRSTGANKIKGGSVHLN